MEKIILSDFGDEVESIEDNYYLKVRPEETRIENIRSGGKKGL